MRLSLEELEKRRTRLDSCPLIIFEHLTELKSFFIEGDWIRSALCVCVDDVLMEFHLCVLGHQW